ncbi:MAG: GntR family transcriptional regulator, partial [Streptosporangiaceae bacterium]
MLAETGVVRRVPGSGGGPFISQDKIERDTSRVVGVPALLRSQGVVAGTRVISAGLSGAQEAAARALGIQRGDLVIDLVRIRLADGSPISVERVMLPADRFPGLLELPLGGSVYELLDEHFGTRPGEAVERIEVVAASPDEAAVLDVSAGTPLLAITRTATDTGGVPFEFSHDLFRGDRIRITVRTPGEAAAACGRLAVEVRRPGQPMTLLTDPVALAAALRLGDAEAGDAATVSRALLDYGNGVIGLAPETAPGPGPAAAGLAAPGPAAPGPAEPWVVAHGRRIGLRAACAELAGWPVGTVT